MAASFSLCRQNLRLWGSDPRYYVVFLYCTVFLWLFVEPYKNFSIDVGVNITPWVFTHLYNSWYVQMITFTAAVMIFCDAPFINDLTPCEFIRVGRARWILSKLMYVFLTSIILSSALFVISVIFLLPNIEFSAEWGRVIKTLAHTTAGEAYGVDVSPLVIQVFSPTKATLLTLSLLVLQFMFIGFSIFTLNLVTNRKYGIIVGVTLAFLPALGPIFAAPKTWWVIPTAWLNAHVLLQSNYYGYPPYRHVFTVLIAGSALLCILSFLLFWRRPIKVMQQP